jgi:hypothetical protein
MFLPKRLTGPLLQFSENPIISTVYAGQTAKLFPCRPSFLPSKSAETAMGGAIPLDSIGFSGTAVPLRFRQNAVSH